MRFDANLMPTRKDFRSSACVSRALICKELIITGDAIFGYLKSSPRVGQVLAAGGGNRVESG